MLLQRVGGLRKAHIAAIKFSLDSTRLFANHFFNQLRRHVSYFHKVESIALQIMHVETNTLNLRYPII